MNSETLKWCKWCFLLLIIALLAFPKCNYGFKLKDITLSERKDGIKVPKRIQFRNLPPLKKIVEVVHVDSEQDEEDGYFKFEKVHKADFDKFKQEIKAETVKEEEAEEAFTETSLEETSEKSFWFFTSILEKVGLGEKKSEPTSNGIIEWLKSLKRKEISEEESPQISDFFNWKEWMFYLNRWPFNLLLHFEKDEESKESETSVEAEIETEKEKEPEPLTQENFEQLLHKLPHFVMNATFVEDAECKMQLQILQRQLRGHKLWTLQMLDATAKVPAGILRGGLNHFGDFDLCTHIRTSVKVTPEQSVRIKGKYCLAHVEIQLKNDELKIPLYMAQGRGLWNSRLENPSHFFPRYTIANWGMCVPNLCSASSVHQMLESVFKPYNYTGLSFHINIQQDDCYVRKSFRPMNLINKNWKIAFTIFFFVFFKIITCLATFIKNWSSVRTWISIHLGRFFIENSSNESQLHSNSVEETEEDKSQGKLGFLKEIFLCFSINRSVSEMKSKMKNQIIILPFLRVLCTILLYVSFKFLMMGHLPITNRDQLVKTLDTPLSIIFRSPLIYLDTLLLISGLLSAMQMHQEILQKSHIYVLKRITGKFLRYLPTLLAVLLFQTWILPYIGSGPLWGTLIGHNAKLCEKNIWRNLFLTQNTVDFEETCSPMTIQLGIELQLYLLTPLLIWLYYYNEDIGFMIYGALHAVSVALRFSKTNSEHLSSTLFHGMNVSKFYRTANLLYASPIQRATAYLYGIGLGIVLQSDYKIDRISKFSKIIGWICSVGSIFWCFWYPSHSMSTDYIYNSSEAATYASWAPLLISIALGWMIFITSTEKLPLALETFLYSKPLLLLSKISYPLQLMTYTIVLISTAETKEPVRFHPSDLINFKEIFVIISLSLILSLFIDMPFKNIRKILVSHSFEKSVKGEIEDFEKKLNNENKMQQEAEITNEQEENSTRLEEEIDDIWGSDTQEEKTTFFRDENKIFNDIPRYEWDKTESADENWQTESDLEHHNFSSGIAKGRENYNEDDDAAVDADIEVDEDDDEDEDVDEDEVIHPESPEYVNILWRRNVFKD